MTIHNICSACWYERNDAEPLRMKNADTVFCCFCRAETAAGIFVKSDTEPEFCDHA